MNKNSQIDEKAKFSKRKKIIITFVCIFLAILIIFGSVLGIIMSVKESESLVVYGSTYFDEGTVNYLTTYYKYQFISAFSEKWAEYSDDMWDEKYEGEKTYGDLLSEYTEQYVRRIAAANSLFEAYSSLTALDEQKIDTAVSEVLLYKADGDVLTFNRESEKFGFDFESFKEAVTVLYKATYVKNAIYGDGGRNVLNFPSVCSEYLKNYSHVKLLFLRTEDKFKLDENGNRVRDENNNDIKIPFTAEEKEARQSLLSEIRGAISAFEKGEGDGQMSPKMFSYYMQNNGDGDPTMREYGYYFSKDSAYSAEFARMYPDIVKKSIDMKKNSYAELEYDGGVCFIYKYSNDAKAYMNSALEGCFSDFCMLAADYHFENVMEASMPEVEIREQFYSIDLTNIPYNYLFVPRF